MQFFAVPCFDLFVAPGSVWCRCWSWPRLGPWKVIQLTDKITKSAVITYQDRFIKILLFQIRLLQPPSRLCAPHPVQDRVRHDHGERVPHSDRHPVHHRQRARDQDRDQGGVRHHHRAGIIVELDTSFLEAQLYPCLLGPCLLLVESSNTTTFTFKTLLNAKWALTYSK